MLTTISCAGYRAFGTPTSLTLGRLTVIFGTNNSGKTTLTRLPLFVRAALASDTLYALHDDLGVAYGTSFRDLTSASAPHPALEYGIADAASGSIVVRLQSVAAGLEEGVQIVGLASGDESVNFEVGDMSSSKGEWVLDAGRLAGATEKFADTRRRLNDALGDAVHIPSARFGITPVYEARPARSVVVEELPYMLHDHPRLEIAVSEWLERAIPGLSLEVERSDYAFRLTSRSVNGLVPFSSVGRGSQALLPLVVLAKAIELRLAEPRLVIIEEPEAHLHPAVHGAVADLLVSMTKQTQVVTETHSENFLLRLRSGIANQTISVSDLALQYVAEDQTVRHIIVDDLGGVDDWPRGVFEEDVAEAKAIIDARIARARAAD